MLNTLEVENLSAQPESLRMIMNNCILSFLVKIDSQVGQYFAKYQKTQHLEIYRNSFTL